MRRVKIYADFPKGITPSYIPKGMARSYISNLISSSQDINGRYSSRSSNSILLKAPTWKSLATLGDLFMWPPLNYGIIFHFSLEIYLLYIVLKSVKRRHVTRVFLFSFGVGKWKNLGTRLGHIHRYFNKVYFYYFKVRATGFDVSEIVSVRFLIQNQARKFCAKHFPWGIVFIIYILRS